VKQILFRNFVTALPFMAFALWFPQVFESSLTWWARAFYVAISVFNVYWAVKDARDERTWSGEDF
jgi:hypothetical protein